MCIRDRVNVYATSALFDRRIRQGGTRKTVVDIYYNNILVESDIPVSAGNVTVDRGAAIRRTATITIPDRKMVPSLKEGGVLEPYGTELKIRQGIVYPNGQEELIPLGVYVLSLIHISEPTRLLSISYAV